MKQSKRAPFILKTKSINEKLLTSIGFRHSMEESRLRKSAQYDKRSFCLTAGKIVPRIRRDDDETRTPEPHTGLQDESGACRGQGRPDTGSVGGAFDVHPNQITSWKAQLEAGAADVFGPGGSSTATALPAIDVNSLHAKIGEMTLENDFLEGALTKAGLLSAKR